MVCTNGRWLLSTRPCCAQTTEAKGQTAIDVAIVGAGIQGMNAARRLTQEGFNVVVLEKQESIGGVWHSWANKSSRVQAHEPFYRIGYREHPEDYTRRENVLLEMLEAARDVGVLDRVRCGVEVARVIDEPSNPSVRVLYRRMTSASNGFGEGRQGKQCDDELEELCAGVVIFCTGGLQQPRRVVLPGEEVFGGPVVDGVASQADKLNMKGKQIVILGMGAFAVENARAALFAGAEHVHLVAPRKNRIITRLVMAIALSFDEKLQRAGDRINAGTPSSQTDPIASLGINMLEPYLKHGARSAMPNKWLSKLDKGKTPNFLTSDSSAIPTQSDVFFIAYALGRLTVHNAQVSCLEKETAVLSTGVRLDADIFIKNAGFESPEKGNRMAGVCEVVGHPTYRPPMWITERVVCFRTEMKHLDTKDPRILTDLYNIPASAPFIANVNIEIFLHFFRHPADLKALLSSDELPMVELSEATFLDHSHGLYAVLKNNALLQAKMDALRREISVNTWKRYAPQGLPPKAQKVAWLHGFLKENREAWRNDCFLLTGDPDAVPFMWEKQLQLMSAQLKMSNRPSGQAAL